MPAQEVPGRELEVLEVERGLARLRLGVGAVERAKELLEKLPVAGRHPSSAARSTASSASPSEASRSDRDTGRAEL